MLSAVWLLLGSLTYSLQLAPGSFPKALTAQEEAHYLALAGQGDLEARNVLIERNLRLVAHITKKYFSQTGDQEDLISIGTIGLIKGISTFRSDKGVRLATYCARWILPDAYIGDDYCDGSLCIAVLPLLPYTGRPCRCTDTLSL